MDPMFQSTNTSRQRDPVRPGPRLRLRLVAQVQGTSIPGWPKPLRRGVNEVIINAEDLEQVQAMVETDEGNALANQAMELHFSKLLTEIQRVVGKEVKIEPHEVDVIRHFAFTSAATRGTAWKKRVSREIASGLLRYTRFWESEFYELSKGLDAAAAIEEGRNPRGRSRLPLASIEELETLDPEVSEQNTLVKDMLQVAGGNAVTHADIAKIVSEAVASTMEAMGGAKAAKKK